jgi:beta-N-acetylhexosaminidase
MNTLNNIAFSFIFTLALHFSIFGVNPTQPDTTINQSKTRFSLSQFYSNNAELDKRVYEIYNQLNDTQRVAQMIITSAGELGKAPKDVRNLVEKGHVGGVIFLKGNINGNTSFIKELNTLGKKHPALLFSIDAEPSLYNRRVLGSSLTIGKTVSLKTEKDIKQTAQTINSEIKGMGFQQNYAPVVDLSTGNEAITHRSFGSDINDVIQKSLWFIEQTQQDNVVATAKHFPGHGFVSGDTHKQNVYIDGELKELPVYPPLIKAGVISIMVGHLTIKNNAKYNTNGLPATCSKTIVTDLLRKELGFKGIIVTDAMNMMAAVNTGESAPLLAAKAGCDQILMPPNEKLLLTQILEEVKKDSAFAKQIEESVKRNIRLKICLGLL